MIDGELEALAGRRPGRKVVLVLTGGRLFRREEDGSWSAYE